MSESILPSVQYMCSRANRVIPKKWHDFTEFMKSQNSSDDEPPVPLILAAWHFTSMEEKRQRFMEQLEWSDTQMSKRSVNGLCISLLRDVHDYLNNLPEAQWFHQDEL